MKVLVAEDDLRLREGLVEILQDEGYQVLQAENGERALALFEEEKPNFLCLDIMMPGLSGYDVCRKVRSQDENIPIIFISAKSEEIDKVLGLELGADDYISKPFGVKEVVARIRAVTRRYNKLNPSNEEVKNFRIGEFEVSKSELRAWKGKKSIDLSLREVMILELFSNQEGQVVDRDTLLNVCWGIDYFPNSRTLDQHISKLRKKIEENPKEPKVIQTVHGSGYRYPGT